MKKLLLTSLFSIGLIFTVNSENVYATEDLEDQVVSIQNTQAFLNPLRLGADSHKAYNLTVSTNAGGDNALQFRAGDGSNVQTKYSRNSATFSHTWRVTGIKTFTTSGRAITSHGPTPYIYGTASVTRR